MIGEYQLLIDTWEGQMEIDEATLLANNVAGMIIRLNDMNGGHHMDQKFVTQWDQARAFCRAPYFVYNPWVSGAQNYVWLAEHMPSDAKAVMLDIEVKYSGISPAAYAAEVKKFHDMVKAKWTTAIYTGEWFLSYLSSWPAGDYWWAQYPYEFYQSENIYLTWDELRTRLQKYDKPFNAAKIPGRLRMWQFTGDTLILPGNPRIMDVNVFYGSREELDDWLGKPAISQPPPPPADMVTVPFPGIKRITGTRHGWQFSLLISDPKKVRFEVVHPQPMTIGTQIAQVHRAEIVVNGGEWDRISMPKDYSVANGLLYVSRKVAVPSLMILADGTPVIDHKNAANVRQAISGLRYIIQNEQIPAYLDGTEPQYTEGHSRSIHGLDGNGQHMCLTSRGAFPNQGLTLKQAAELMRQYGSVIAFDSGGGGDVTEVIDGELTNLPENIISGVNVQRLLPQFLLIHAQEASMNGTAKESRGTASTIRKAPSRYGESSTSKVPAGSVIEFVEIVPVQVMGTADNPNDKWFKLPDGTYVNYILSGLAYYMILTQPTNPIPPPIDGTMEAVLTDKDANGNVVAVWKGTLIKQ